MPTHKITQEHEKCIGCGACAAVCSENWVMTNDGKAKPKKTQVSDKDLECNKQAQDACPVQCIHVK